MQEVIERVACPLCLEEGRDSSCDNAHVFESGYANCVAGHGSIGKLTDEIKEQSRKVLFNNQNDSFKSFEYAAIQSRNISKKTCEYYGYGINREDKCHVANYYDSAGNIIMQQLRTADKKFPILGDKKGNEQLWGSHKFSPNEQVFITITEGQIDALSIAEVFDCKYPIVSIPNGVNNAANVLLKNKKYLDKFKYVVLAFDNDAPGIKATEECLKLFEPGKCRVAKWNDAKDANELLQQERRADIRKVIYDAKEFIPSSILTGQSLLDTFETYELKTKPWPWKKANETINPIFIPGIYTLAAWPSVGKTLAVSEIMRESIAAGKNIGAVSLEQSASKLTLKLSAAIGGIDLTNIRNRKLTKEEIQSLEPIANKIVAYDHKTFGADLFTILENLPYMAQALNCEYIIFDNLSFAASGLEADERRGIDKAMLDLKQSTEKYNYTLFNICHLNDDDEDFTKCSIRGSRAVHMYSDYSIYLGRDIESQDKLKRNSLKFYVKKDRETGEDTGKSFILKYDTKTKRLL